VNVKARTPGDDGNVATPLRYMPQQLGMRCRHDYQATLMFL